ncbi:MAG TPA: ABC transporter permease, partial [Vicinamibacterales bacterium]|nr:ABC transporter permease [Vicinamibacterales bacterium]
MLRDIRYALRVLRARPAFSAVAILTLALGIGANTAIFTVVNAVLLRGLPFHEPDRLVLLLERTARFPTVTTSWQNYVDWRDQSRSFDAVGALRSVTMTMTGGSEAERVPAKMITATTLPILGVSPAIGRNFSPEEDRPGSAGVALLSDALWRRRFGAAQDITGRAMTLDNKPYTIVGVLPPRFQLLAAADVLLPMGPWAATLPDDRGWHPGIFPLARLKAGTTLRQAQAEMDLISDRLAKQYPEFDQGVSAEVKPLHDYAVQNVRQSLVLLAGAVGFVLLIACANVANLLLVRAVGRQKEIAIRTAIGASRARIARQLIAESVLLALAGGAAGLLLAFWTVPLLAVLAGANAPAASAIAIDATALMFTIALSLATGVLFGFAPALQTARVDVAAAINDGGRGAAAGAAHHRLRGLLVVSEVALATMLLVGAGLLTRSLLHLQDTATGFQSEGLLVADAPLSPGAYDTTAKRNAFVERLLERLRATPGVEAAAIATAPPFSGGGSTIHFNITGRPPKGPEEYILTGLRAVTTDYFSALGVPLVAGRGLTDRDRDQSPPVAIVNETFAKRYFGNQARQAVGARAQLGTVPDDDSPRMEIVGIVGDTKQAFEADIQPTMYVPYLQPPIDVLAGLYRNLSILLKTSGNPAALAGGLRQAVTDVDRDQPLARVRTMEDAMAESVTQPRLRTILLALLSAIALLLSLIGVYGVMAYSVSERTHEIGVRIALGASPAEIRALIMSEGTRLAAVGIAIGVAGALAMSRALSALLFGISATDPVTFVLAAAALAVAALAAAYAPARRAGRIDPV